MQIMAGFDSLPLATWTAEYRAARREIQGRKIQFRAIGTELARRLTERTAHWRETVAMMRFSYGCPCGGGLAWNDETTIATCEICATVYDGISGLTVIPDE